MGLGLYSDRIQIPPTGQNSDRRVAFGLTHESCSHIPTESAIVVTAEYDFFFFLIIQQSTISILTNDALFLYCN